MSKMINNPIVEICGKRVEIIPNSFYYSDVQLCSREELKKGIKKAGSVSEFSRLVGVSRQLIYYWLRDSKYGVGAGYVRLVAKKANLNLSKLRMDLYPE